MASPFKAVKLSKYSGPIHTSQPNGPHEPQMTRMPLPGQPQGQPITAQGPPGVPGQQPSGKVILNVEHHFMDNGKLVKKVGCSGTKAVLFCTPKLSKGFNWVHISSP